MRVLIVVSSFTPATPANVHRARMLAWCLDREGWDVEILTPSKEFQRPEWLDADSEVLFPPQICRHEAVAMLGGLFDLLQMRGISWRALLPIYRLGSTVLGERRFDLVYISTTTFTFFCLGRLWAQRFGVPYVLDFQDPWYRAGPLTVTTRHRLKLWVTNKLAKYMEAFAINGASGLVSVSPYYLDDLRARYPSAAGFRPGRQEVIPFGVLPLDLELACRRSGRFVADNEHRTIAYVGVGAALMRRSFRRLMDGVARLRKVHPEIAERCRFLLKGTQGAWKPSEPRILFDEAVAAGVGNLVEEDPRVVSYPVATAVAVAADGLLVLGVDDPAYMPSKLFLYAATQKPLLACMHWQSQANPYFERLPELGELIHFNAPATYEVEEDSRILAFLTDVVSRRVISRQRVMAEHSASTMARRHARLFQDCLARS